MLFSRLLFVFVLSFSQIGTGALPRADDNQEARTLEDFLNDPVSTFDRIKGMSDLCNEIMTYDLDSIRQGRRQESYLDMLFARHFKEIDDRKMRIVIYLFLNLRSCQGDILKKTTAAFVLRPRIFAKTLESTSEWKSIIDDISRDWSSFSPGLDGLGSTEFEIAVKDYATILHEERAQREKDIEAFINDPVGCFDRVKDLDDICLWIGRYEHQYLDKEGVQKKFLLDALFDGPFKSIDENKVRIMIHLVLHCGHGGIQGEVLADRVAKAFRAQPQLFARVLEKCEDWKKVIDKISILGWDDFSRGLEGLGNSAFEKEIKSYVASRR
jgi:hypothetical protein